MGDETKEIASYVLLAVLFGLGAWLLFDRDALRDGSRLRANKPFSLARVQLWWWTLIILGAELTLYGFHKTFWPFNYTCLALLGISAATTALGRAIDDRQERDPARERNQDVMPSEGFWRDILSDEHGLSVHRYQTVMFNLAFGVGFLLDTFGKEATTFPTFDSMTLALLGVSSGAYVALKATENSAVSADTKAVANSAGKAPPSDELLDPETAVSPPPA